MTRTEIKIALAGCSILTMTLAAAITCVAQEPPREPTQESAARQAEQPRRKADGELHGLPIETYAVAPGTKFLVRLEEDLGTKGAQENAKFKVRTLEPLEAGSGILSAARGGD